MKIVRTAVLALIITVLIAQSAAVTAQTITGAGSWSYRLAGPESTSNYGRLEARQDSGAWGTVCDDLFDDSDAIVACRSLGFNTTRFRWERAPYNMRGSFSQPTVMDNLQCTGTEASLDRCTFVRHQFRHCSHWRDIVIMCRDPNEVFEYRLAGDGATATSGRLEVRIGTTTSNTFAEWGTVCDDPEFNYREALVACKSLGLNTTHPFYSTVAPAFLGASSQPTTMSDLACDGTEDGLDVCSFTNTTSDCNHTDAVQLTCTSSSAAWEYRLAGPNSTSHFGRLEARPSADLEWGTVCDTFRFDDDNEATVACRSLGVNFTKAAKIYLPSMRGNSSQPHAFDYVHCDGAETALDKCGTSYANGCYGTDVVIKCRDPNEVYEYRLAGPNATSTSGRLETRGFINSEWAAWGTVCRNIFYPLAATVACRSLGLNTSHPTFWTASPGMRGDPTQPINMANVLCNKSEATLDLCDFRDSLTQNCNHNADLVISCPTPSDPWEYRLTGDGATATYGRLEARSNAYAPWGTVCSERFDLRDARVACRSLGLNTSRAAYYNLSLSNMDRADESAPITFRKLNCTGNEASLSECGSSDLVRDCLWHSQDVILRCPDASETWQYRLGGISNASNYGLLEAREFNGGTWGTVCNDHFDINDARVACRSLGLNDSFASFSTATFFTQGRYFQPIVMDDVRCSGTESLLHECTFTGQQAENCDHFDDIMVSCPNEPPTWQYRLAGPERTSTYGRLEMRYGSASPWGTVCDDLFNAVDARVACRSLGLTPTYAAFATATGSMRGTSSQPITMDDMQCGGSETSLNNCTYDSTHNCGHHEDIVLSCPPTPQWEYRLGGSFATWTFGRLEARAIRLGPWGTVCNDGFDLNDARVACRSLGLGTSGVSYSTALARQQGDGQPIVMDDLGCAGDESDLANCSFTGGTEHNCGHHQDIIINCGAPTTCPVTRTSSLHTMSNCSCDVALCRCIGGAVVPNPWWSHTRSFECHLGSTIACMNRTACSENYLRCNQRLATSSSAPSYCRADAVHAEVRLLDHSLEDDQTNTELVNNCRNWFCGVQQNLTCIEAGAGLPTYEEETQMCIAAAANLTGRSVCNCNGRGQSYTAPWLPAGCGCSCNWPFAGSNCSECARVTDYFDSFLETCRSCTGSYTPQTFLAASGQEVHVPLRLNPTCTAGRRVMYYGGHPTSRWRATYANLTAWSGFSVNAFCTNRRSNRRFPITNSMYMTGGNSWFYLGRVMCTPPLSLSVPAPRRVHLHLIDLTDSAVAEMLAIASTLLANGTDITFSTYRMWQVSDRVNVSASAGIEYVTSFLEETMATRSLHTTMGRCALFPTSANMTLPRMIEGTGAEAVIGFGTTSTSCAHVQTQLADVVRAGVQLGWVGTADTTGLWYVTALTYTSSDFWALEEQVDAFFSARGAATCEDAISFPPTVRAMTRRAVQIPGACNVTSCCVGSSCSRFAINRGSAGCTTPLVWRRPAATDVRSVSVNTANGEQNDTTTIGANRHWSGGVYAYRERTWDWRRVDGFFQSRGNYTNRVRVYRYRASVECCKLVGVTFDNKVAGELTSQTCFTSTRRWGSLLLTIPALSAEQFARPVRTVAVQCGARPTSIADAVDGGSFRVPAVATGSNTSSGSNASLTPRDNGADPTTTHSPSNLQRISRYVTAVTGSAGTQSSGQALRRVRVALETAGLRSTIAANRRPCRSTDIPGPSGECEFVWSGSAADARPFLESAGFEKVDGSSTWALESVMRGDIVVFPAQAADGTPAANGTIAVVSSPTSSFGLVGDVQHSFYPYATGTPASVGSSEAPSVYRLAALVEEVPMGSEALLPLVAAKAVTQDKQAYCDAFFAWDEALKATIFAEAVDFMNSRYRCPALLDRFTRPRQFGTAWDMTGLNVSFGVQCFSVSQWWIRGRPRQHGTGARCCYDVNNTYIPSWPSRVTFSESDQWIWSDAVERDAENVCCGEGVHTADTQACLAFRARRPALRLTNAPFVTPMRWWPRRRGAGGWGDPHCNSYDGVSFECNFHGEALWTACDSWKVHAVAEPVGATSAATVITKFAVQYNETTAIGELLTTTDTNTYYQITLNGDEITSDVTEGDLTVAFDNDTITFTSAGGDEVTAVFSRRLITLSTVPAEDCRGRATGLSGNFDGNSTNDLRVPGTDTYLSENATSASIYRDFVLPHLVSDLADSLFQGMTITTNTSYTPAFIDSIDLSNCPSACQGNRACCFDASIGGAEFAAEFVAAQATLSQQQQGAIGFNENFPPVFTVATDVITLDSANGTAAGTVTLASYTAFDADTVTTITCDLCSMTGVTCTRSHLGTVNASLVVVAPMPTQEGSISCTATDANGGIGRATTLVLATSSFGGGGYSQLTTTAPETSVPPDSTLPQLGEDSSASPVAGLLAVLMPVVAALALLVM